MLDLYQITELENAWERLELKRKQKYKIIVMIAICLAILCALVLAIYYSFSAGRNEIIEENAQTTKIAQNKLEQARIQELKKQALLKSQRTHLKTTSNQELNNIEQKSAKTQQSIKPEQDHQLSAQPQENLQSINTKKAPMPNFDLLKPPSLPQEQKPTQKIKLNLKQPESFEVKPGKAQKIGNEIDYLKDRFAQTKSIYFALDIANVYLSQKDYAKAERWALIANDIDDHNEKSWVLFAKAKAAQGNKKEARKILKNYLAHNPDSSAASLLLGELH